MEIKVIIILVCASLVTSTNPPKWVISFEQSNQTVAIINKIIVNQENTIKALYSNGFELILKIFSKVKKKLLANCLFEPDDYSSKITTALVSVQKGFDISLNTILIALEKPCPAVEDARKPIRDYLDDAFEHLTAALTVAVSGNDCGNRSAIKVHQDAAKMKFKKSCRRAYNSTYRCLNTTDSDTLSVIKGAQNGSVKGLNRMCKGLFGVLEAISSAVCTEEVDTKLGGSITDGYNITLDGLKSHDEYFYSLLKTLFLQPHLNPSVSICALAANQYGLTRSTNEYRDGNKVFMDFIEDLFRIIFMEGNKFSPSDHSLSEMIRKYDDGDESILVAANAVDHDAASAIAAARKILLPIAIEGPTIFYNAAYLASAVCSNYSKSLAEIETFENATVAPATDYTNLFFSVFLGNRTFDNETEAYITDLREKSTYGGVLNTVVFYDAMKILLKTTCKSRVNKSIFCILKSILDTANLGVDYFCQGIFALGIKVLQNSTPNSVNCSCT